ANGWLMQFQADMLGVPVVVPEITETTALGAAYGAGLAAGLWSDLGEIRDLWAEDARWTPTMGVEERERLHNRWGEAVRRSLDWA
ncbi:MAG TPA: FGGY-family carbohydrate kinase, partial [Acidimicrobiia bacterium]|nr:FGGY-family carbohydrate kinase [Acidimicrobiia bacterium]